MNRLKWGRMTVLLVIVLGICWFLFQGTQKSATNVEGQPLQVAELPKAGFTEKQSRQSIFHQKLMQKQL